MQLSIFAIKSLHTPQYILITNINNYLNNLKHSLKQREVLPQDSDNEEEHEEEKPVVVVLNSEHLTAEQAEAYKKKKGEGIKCINFIYDNYT